jgi:anhydro-N-acetylmuramic acid kinase
MRYDEDGRLAARGTPIVEVIDELLAHPVLRRRTAEEHGTRAVRRGVRRAIHRALSRDAKRCVGRGRDRDGDRAHRAQHRRCVSAVHARAGDGGAPERRRREERHAADDDRDGAGAADGATFDERYFDGEAKEAVAFAPALLHLQSRAGNVPTATGARGFRVLGR